MSKTLDESFRDWEGSVFGYGYGSGEEHVLGALKAFMAAIPDRAYDSRVLEAAVTAPVAWLLINALCHADIIEYGTSPRGGWLTEKGKALQGYVSRHSTEELAEIVCNHDEDYTHCYPTACNCGPHGYEEGRACSNPFWGT